MANLNVDGTLTATIVTAQQTLNCDSSNIWFGGAQCVASGSNANGYWARYYDGTQICKRTLTYGSTGDQTVTLPNNFIDTDYAVTWGASSTSTTTISFRAMSARNRSTTTFVNRFVANVETMYIAIGRWK